MNGAFVFGIWVVVETCYPYTAFPISPWALVFNRHHQSGPQPQESFSVILFDSLAFCFREQELELLHVSFFWFLMQIGLNSPRTGLHGKVAGLVIRDAVPKSSPCLLTAAGTRLRRGEIIVPNPE